MSFTIQSNNFYLISGSSVASNYTDDSPTGISPVAANASYISGYSPNMTVTYQESCVPETLPISAYGWDFGDVFRGSESNQTVSATQVLTPSAEGWVTDQTNHYKTYVYKYPGLYNVTLDTWASAGSPYTPGDTLYAAPCSRDLLVYVKEIQPTATFGVSHTPAGPFTSSVTFSSTPMTVYFNASGTVTGSFPIGKVVWNFGDGTTMTVLSSIAGKPQTITVSNEYNRTLSTDPSTFNVSFSAFAYETDSLAEYSITGLGPIAVSAVAAYDWPVHLLAATMYDDDELLLVFEGDKKGTFSYILSTGGSV